MAVTKIIARGKLQRRIATDSFAIDDRERGIYVGFSRGDSLARALGPRVGKIFTLLVEEPEEEPEPILNPALKEIFTPA